LAIEDRSRWATDTAGERCDTPPRDTQRMRDNAQSPAAVHSVSRNASQELPASLIAFFVLDGGECATVYDRD